MILETGRIVAIEPRGLWVETIQHSACGSCRAQKGCGHSLLAKFGASPSHIWILLDGRSSDFYQLDEEVCIGIPEDIIVRGAIFIYMLPLITMILASIIAHQQAVSDSMNALWALGGLLLGGVIVRWRSQQTRFDRRLQPVLVDDQTPMQILNVYSAE